MSQTVDLWCYSSELLVILKKIMVVFGSVQQPPLLYEDSQFHNVNVTGEILNQNSKMTNSAYQLCLESIFLCFTGNATAVKQSRYRIIIQDAANGGQACPDTLYEERECEDIPVCPVYR